VTSPFFVNYCNHDKFEMFGTIFWTTTSITVVISVKVALLSEHEEGLFVVKVSIKETSTLSPDSKRASSSGFSIRC